MQQVVLVTFRSHRSKKSSRLLVHELQYPVTVRHFRKKAYLKKVLVSNRHCQVRTYKSSSRLSQSLSKIR